MDDNDAHRARDDHRSGQPEENVQASIRSMITSSVGIFAGNGDLHHLVDRWRFSRSMPSTLPVSVAMVTGGSSPN